MGIGIVYDSVFDIGHGKILPRSELSNVRVRFFHMQPANREPVDLDIADPELADGEKSYGDGGSRPIRPALPSRNSA
jgi:hypothetical protein